MKYKELSVRGGTATVTCNGGWRHRVVTALSILLLGEFTAPLNEAKLMDGDWASPIDPGFHPGSNVDKPPKTLPC
jgi:hypothetical protein